MHAAKTDGKVLRSNCSVHERKDCGYMSDNQMTEELRLRCEMSQEEKYSVAQLNDLIYQSALRSRAAYSDTADAVGKMGLNAKNAFSSNEELIAFTEQVNKQFKIGGASAQEQSNAMIQLTQAMAAGVLRGQDLNSILAAAPGIARTIEESMGWASGSIKQYAEDGKVTAQVVKNSLLNMADETNEKFASMPMTLSDAMTQGKNIVQHSAKEMAQAWNDFIQTDKGHDILGETISLFSVLTQVGTDALAAIGQGALFVADNMDMIIPMLTAVGAVFLFVKAQAIQTALASAAAAGTHAAAWAAANWPVLLMAALFAGALIAAQQFGVGMQEVGGWVGQVFGMIYAVGYNVFATLWNAIASFAEFFANVFNDPVAAIAHLFSDALDAILSMVETVAGAIDALTGSHLQGAVSGFRGKMSSWVDSTFGENAIQIKRMANLDIGTTAAEWGNYGANLGAKLDNLSLNIGDLAGSFGDLQLGDGIGKGDIANAVGWQNETAGIWYRRKRGIDMDFGIGSVTAITAICYLGGMACKATTKVKDEVIPVVCGVTGGILGVAGMYLMPEFPATDVINAAAIGIVSGLAATGAHQVIKQASKK